MDYFFAQIEERENPHFVGKPIIVGADPKRGRGVVSTANYEARKYGIKSGMPISRAWKLCPHAIFLPVNIKLYERVSERIMEIIRKYSSIYEIVSIDEAYLELKDISNYDEALKLAEKLRKEILEKERLTCSIGIGPNKLIAKLAGEKSKPNGLMVVRPEDAEKFLDPLDIQEIPGIGPKTAETLRGMGIHNIKELKTLSREKIQDLFGKRGQIIFERARGIDNEPVEMEERIKSVSRQTTLEKDTRDSQVILGTFEKILKDAVSTMRSQNQYANEVGVIIRDSDFKTQSKSSKLSRRTKDPYVIKRVATISLLKLLLANKKPIRLVGIRLRIG